MPTLLSPLSVAGLTLRNRIAMPPMWSGQAGADGSVTDRIVEYHRVRAAAGCGLITVEHSFVHPGGRHSATQLGLCDDAMIPGLARLAAAITSEGAVACLQISHAGSRASSAVLGRKPVAPSAVRHPGEPDGGQSSQQGEHQHLAIMGQFLKHQNRRRARERGWHPVGYNPYFSSRR